MSDTQEPSATQPPDSFPQEPSANQPPDSFLAEMGRLIEALSAGGPIPHHSHVRRIGRYELAEILGSGGYGLVYRAFDPVTRRHVALKVPLPEVLACPDRRRRFVKEAAILARLKYRHVLGYHDADNLGGVCYIATELCAYGSLADWLLKLPEGQEVPVLWAVDVVRQAALGVHHAHENNVHHRDLKPGNLLLTLDQPHDFDTIVANDSEIEFEPTPGRDRGGGNPRFPLVCVKVGDFGLAKLLDDDRTSRTGTEALLGTRHYMSPEQVQGDIKKFVRSSDVYALGVILFELLTRRRPFEGDGDALLLDQIRHEPSPSPRSFRRDIKAGLETVCLKCLEKNPKDRYQSAGELANELARIAAGQDPLAQPKPWWKRARERVKRHPIRAAMAGLTLVATLAGGNYYEKVHEAEIESKFNSLGEMHRWTEVIPTLDAFDAIVKDHATLLYVAGTPTQKLAAALVLAPAKQEYANAAFEALLKAEPREIATIASLLQRGMTNLRGKLKTEARRQADPTWTVRQREAHDRRRANAGCALATLDDPAGLSLLAFHPDPQARSFLVHLLGPAGFSPRAMLDRLKSESDDGTRRALILALGEVPTETWNPRDRATAEAQILARYENDPDPGVHGSAKWLLRRWGLQDRLNAIDETLKGKPPEGKDWRIGKSGLTFVRMLDAATGRTLEITDTEITRDVFLRFRPDHKFNPESCPTPDSPISGTNYNAAVAFCNWLSEVEGIPADQWHYSKNAVPAEHRNTMPIGPDPTSADRGGFRLLTDREFATASHAGTTTTRYHGDSPALLGYYAEHFKDYIQLIPTGRLKPNDYGLFDMMGNAMEVCQARGDPENPVKLTNLAIYCGGSVLQNETQVNCESRTRRDIVNREGGLDTSSFRVARTVPPGQ